MGISGQGASALVRGSGVRQPGKILLFWEDFSGTLVYAGWAPLGNDAPDAGIQHTLVIIPHLWAPWAPASLNFSRFSFMRNGKSYAYIFEIGI